jgi:hypothetical protein
MASAPQNATRIAPDTTPAPPARAASAPNSARKNSDVPDTKIDKLVIGASVVVTSGIAAPTAKLPADASAA